MTENTIGCNSMYRKTSLINGMVSTHHKTMKRIEMDMIRTAMVF
jgi:hypothetical protein